MIFRSLGAGIFIILALVLCGIYFVTNNVLKIEQYIAISIGLIGWLIAVIALFLQIRLSLRRKLEAAAIKDLLISMREFSEPSAMAVTFANDFVVKPQSIPTNFWHDKAFEKYDSVAKHTMKIREGYGQVYLALETHEIAIIHLQRYYRFITLRIDDFIQKIDNGNSLLLQAMNEPNFDENAYKLAVKNAFGELMVDWANLSVYFMDFRKLLQTDLLGKVFLRELLPREPYDGSSTLSQIATEERVTTMVSEREAEFRK